MAWIYCIENTINNKKYIGKSIKSTKYRWYHHKFCLKRNTHVNKHLQQSWNKYGENFFAFQIIEECEKEKLSEREIFWIEIYKTFAPEFGYNLTKGGDGGIGNTNFLGKHHTKETKIKMSNSQKGKILSKEHRKKISETKNGRPSSFLGKKHSEESKKKMSENMPNKFGKNNPMFGKHHTEKAKELMSEISLYKKKKNSSSNFFGVSFNKNENNWSSWIIIKRKKIHLGRFKKEIEAAETYNNYVISNNLPHPLNFQN